MVSQHGGLQMGKGSVGPGHQQQVSHNHHSEGYQAQGAAQGLV